MSQTMDSLMSRLWKVLLIVLPLGAASWGIKLYVIVYRVWSGVIPPVLDKPLDKSPGFCYGKVDEC
jgi:hypothetical protein